MKFSIGAVILSGAFAASGVSAVEPIRIAVIDPLSSSFANVGESQVREAQLAVEGINARGGVLGGRMFEIVDFDGKGSPQESLLALKRAVDQGIRIVNQTSGSSVAAALIDAINKHNVRNPDRTVLYLNTGAVDPALTNDKCSFWHFRFDADADMKMIALTDSIAYRRYGKASVPHQSGLLVRADRIAHGEDPAGEKTAGHHDCR